MSTTAAVAAMLWLATAASCQRQSSPPAGRGEGGSDTVAGAGALAPVASVAPPVDRSAFTYVERQPPGAADEALPMVVAIHGLGDTPEHLGDALVSALGRRVRVVLPRGPKAHNGGFSWFDLGSDRGVMVAGIERATALVAAGVGDLAKRRPTRGRPIVLGFSQGGMVSFALAARHPTLASACFPVAGFLPDPLMPPPGAGPLPPLVAFHGADDRLIPVALARASIDRLKALGVSAEIHVYPGLGHSISPELKGDLKREIVRVLDALPAEAPPLSPWRGPPRRAGLSRVGSGKGGRAPGFQIMLKACCWQCLRSARTACASRPG
ncbi:MAG: alpha/beta fold hydrolase [Polyangiaceae bacterium]|jgi:phospholipase/carboxylesterase|nr:alpha/beta fold hydrolase [Polyangiaceae bacterium]